MTSRKIGPALLVTTAIEPRRRLGDGLHAFRDVVRRFDGDGTPWLRVERIDGRTAVEVVGQAGAMRLELTDTEGRLWGVAVRMRGHETWVTLPEPCHPWVEECRADELIESGLAASIGWRWLTEGSFDDATFGRRAREFGVRTRDTEY